MQTQKAGLDCTGLAGPTANYLDLKNEMIIHQRHQEEVILHSLSEVFSANLSAMAETNIGATSSLLSLNSQLNHPT